MARKKKPPVARVAVAEPKEPPAPARSPHAAAVALLILAVLVFHWQPLFSARASIQWDAVDVHYSLQKYFGDHARQGRLPQWTPYVFSGYPFLADPQTGAWYPLNWPFFLAGITPRALQAELALHTLLAALGAYLFAWRKLGRREPALAAALAYAMSGFFAAHASHVGMFQAAAWLGWIVLAADRAVAERGVVWKLTAGLLTGVMILAGHFQTALYTGFGVAAYVAWLVIEDRARWRRAVAALAAMAVIGLSISAVMVAPGLELLERSVRATADFRGATNSPLVPGALATLIHPNFYGLLDGNYQGPEDVTQYYYYGGLLLLPLAALGLTHRGARWPALALAVPALWYAFGPAGGLYLILSKLPGLGTVRAPVHIWFVTAFGLAALAGAGTAQAVERWKLGRLALLVPAMLFFDLLWFNSARNPLAYSRGSFEELYGAKLAEFEQQVASRLPELSRLHAPHSLAAFGPQNHPLDARAETTYGYNPLRVSSYNTYHSAATGNPRLLAALGARFRYLPESGSIEASADVLPRASIPKRIVAAADERDAARRLAALDPAEAAVVVGHATYTQDSAGSVSVVAHDEGVYRISYRLKMPTLVRIAEAYYPGWEAEAGGRPLPVVAVDAALIGVVAPAGEGELRLRFRSRRLPAAAGVSLGAAALVAGLLIRSLRSRGRAVPTPG